MSYPIKLVRDRIDKIRGDRERIVFERLGRNEHIRLLRRKLIEEAVEYMDNPCLEELGDVLAVVRALAHVDLQVEWPELQGEELRKFHERGGFEQGTIMSVGYS